MSGQSSEARRRRKMMNAFETSLRLNRGGAIEPATWFLGPKAENEELFVRLAEHALRQHGETRKQYFPDDPPFITDKIRKSPPFKEGTKLLETRLNELLHALRGSLPLASYRNQSHMYWDVTMPSTLGYIAALMFNQNNVAAEASPVTTFLETIVGEDLCTMVGFPVPETHRDDDKPTRPWGHITCDGSIANGESMWAARNMRFQALSIARAIQAEDPLDHDAPLAPARNITIRTARGDRQRLIDLSTWDLLNIPVDETVALNDRLVRTTGVDEAGVSKATQGFMLQRIGLTDYYRRLVDADIGLPVVFAPATAHYSWPKTAALIGLGSANARLLPVDVDGRMDTVALRHALDHCLTHSIPVLQVVAVIGSTGEGAVDPLTEILDIRQEYREMGLDFALHVDGAWGGYFASMLRDASLGPGVSFLNSPHFIDRRPDAQLSDYVSDQLAAIGQVDSVTLDPHKSGFCPYPAGALCYRNGAMRDAVTYTAPVVFHGDDDPTIGQSGIEGSKPGAAPAGVYLSHSLIPPDRAGYGRLLGRCVFNNKRYHAALTSMPRDNDPFTVTVLQRLPAEREGCTPAEIQAQIDYIRREIVALENAPLLDKLSHDDEVFRIFRLLGSDLSILTYAFNFKTAHGVNTDVGLMNELNDAIFHDLSLSNFNGGEVPKEPMFVTAAEFDPGLHGAHFVDHFAKRAGLPPTSGDVVKVLISTAQNPWLTETRPTEDAEPTNFIPTLMEVLRHTVTGAVARLVARHDLPPFSHT